MIYKNIPQYRHSNDNLDPELLRIPGFRIMPGKTEIVSLGFFRNYPLFLEYCFL